MSKKSLYALIIAILFIVIFISIYALLSTNESKPMSTEQLAYYAARQAISNQLKSPSSAKYGAFEDSGMAKLDNNEYLVAIEVESKNALGVMLRKTFTVKVRDEGGEWRVISVTESK